MIRNSLLIFFDLRTSIKDKTTELLNKDNKTILSLKDFDSFKLDLTLELKPQIDLFFNKLEKLILFQ